MKLSHLENGYAAARQNDIETAVHCFQQAVLQHPRNPEPLACLGQAYCWQGDRHNGLAYLHKAAKVIAKQAKKTKDISDLLAISEQLQAENDYPGSLQFVRQTVQIKRTDVRAYQLLALTYARLNQQQQALQASLQALKIQPDNPRLNIQHAALLADMQRYETGKQRLEQVLLETGLAPEDLFKAHKELARILDKLGEFHNVFKHLHKASQISKELQQVRQLDANTVPEMLSTYQAEFDSKLLHRWSKSEFTSSQAAPVFLLGFLRSGTTLIQQVLDAHPQVIVADETELISALRSELNRIAGNAGTTPQQLLTMSKPEIQHLRSFYWDWVHKYIDRPLNGRLFIDKTSLNTIDLGLINCVFPDAKILFVQRDPRDVCLSCFMQAFALTPATLHFLSWENTLSFYAQTMNWWLYIKQHMALDYIECRYEDAVSDFDSTFQSIFRFLNLDWNDSVQHFHRLTAKKFIASPSFHQVTQPLYSSSIARWKNYSEEFSRAEELLQPFIRAFNY